MWEIQLSYSSKCKNNLRVSAGTLQRGQTGGALGHDRRGRLTLLSPVRAQGVWTYKPHCTSLLVSKWRGGALCVWMQWNKSVQVSLRRRWWCLLTNLHGCVRISGHHLEVITDGYFKKKSDLRLNPDLLMVLLHWTLSSHAQYNLYNYFRWWESDDPWPNAILRRNWTFV